MPLYQLVTCWYLGCSAELVLVAVRELTMGFIVVDRVGTTQYPTQR